MPFWMNPNDVAPRSDVRVLGMGTANILLHSLGKLFSEANQLTCVYPASISMINSSLIAPTPLRNLRQLIIRAVIPGLELLLDGVMLPRLQSLNGLIVPLFIAFARRENQMKTLDTVDHLVITDQSDSDEKCFSFKQWHTVLDVLPRLRTLLIQFHNAKCPPMGMTQFFIDYIKRKIRSPLTLFSCCIDHYIDANSKEHFITYLEERIQMECSCIQMASIGPTRLDVWM
jgi:hypothetical protein